ncbi:MAG: hypothetical protein CMO55_04330 [Verrucomicrobiales bacterium]|nr:hypothetical protein [Verrucomicrobiales bacterium]
MKRIEVKVKPNARESSLTQGEDGNWVARLKSPPVDGKANRELIALVAKKFGVAKRQIVIRIGAGSRLKQIQILD